MNTQTTVINLPTLAVSTGQWRAIYWEPVMQTGERICVGFLTLWDQHARAVMTLRPDLLSALFGATGDNVQVLLERGFRLMNAQLNGNHNLAKVIPPMSGLFFGEVEVCHVNAYAELLQIAKLMSSSLSSLAEPDNPDSADDVDNRPEQAQPARHFLTRVRDLALKRDIRLASYFNNNVALKRGRRLTRFGFLSDSLVAHFGLLQPTNSIRNSVRMTRGLIAELTLAHRDSERHSLLILGFPPLESPTLSGKERGAIRDYTEQLEQEAEEFGVGFAGVDNDTAACDALMAAL
jgi:hypothetical protein